MPLGGPIRRIYNLGGFYAPILVMQVVLLVFAPVPQKLAGIVAMNGLYYGSLVLGVYASRSGRRLFYAYAAVGAGLFVFNAFLPLSVKTVAYPVTLPIDLVFLLAAILSILVHVVRARRVTGEVIVGAIAVYFLAGMLWAFLFIQIDKMIPGAFAVAHSITDSEMTVQLTRLNNFLYYSFTSLTTLGFGDITPVHPVARGVTLLETFFGQIYLVVLVARLVGMQIAQGRMGSE